MNRAGHEGRIGRPGRTLVTLALAWGLSVGFASRSGAQASEAAPPPAAGSQPAGGGPVAVFPELTKDFGEFWAGEDLTYNFVVRNTGDQVLQLVSVKPSCGCTSTGYDREIPPGGQGKVSAKLSTKNIAAKFSKTITVTTNDPTHAAITLTLTGTAKQRIELEPRNATWTQVQADEVLSKTVRITNRSDQPLTLSLDADKADVFTAVLKEVEPGKAYDLEISARPPYQPRLNHGVFNLTSNIPDKPKIDVPCSAYVPPRLEVRPDQVRLRPVVHEPTKETLRFINNGKNPVRVVGVELADEKVTTAIREENPGKDYAIELQFPEDYRPGANLQVVVRTDDAEVSSLSVPIAQLATPQPMPKPGATLVGQPAPRVTLTTVRGESIAVGEPRADALVLAFYASWNPYTNRVLPELEKVHQTYRERGVRVVAISVDERTGKAARTEEQVAEAFTSLKLTMDRVLDPQKTAGTPYFAQTYPMVYLIGKNGVVEAAYLGTQADLFAALSQDLDALQAGRAPSATPKAASSAARSTDVKPPRLQPAKAVASEATPALTAPVAPEQKPTTAPAKEE